MKNNRITFIGTTSHKSARNTQNGECLRIVNLRQQNNSLISTSNSPISYALADAERVLLYVHTCNEQQHFISQHGRTLYHESDINIQDNSTEVVNKKLLTLDDDLSSITSVGTTLIVTTASTIQYILHRNDSYIILGSKPPMPIIRFQDKFISVEALYINATSFTGQAASANIDLLNNFTNHVLGTFYKLRDGIYERFRFLQPYIIRYALRLYDGTHILPSPPFFLGRSGISVFSENLKTTFTYDSTNNTSTMTSIPLVFDTYGIEYTIEQYGLELWRDIVVGIDLFISKEFTLTEDRCIEGKFTPGSNNNTTYNFTLPLTDEGSIEKAAYDESLFYKLFTIDLDNIEIGVTKEVTHGIRTDNIIYQPRLNTNTSEFAQIGAKKSYVYNGRLHLADITHRYYEGYPLSLFTTSYNTENNNALTYIRTTVSLPDGSNRKVLSYASIPHFNYKLSPMLSFPDSNATSMEIVVRHNGYEYRKTFKLKSVENENRASYIEPLLNDINVYSWENTEITVDNLNDFPLQSETFSYQSRNEMIVSELNNPFYFPLELSFNISKGIIVGIATTTIALSQGQYGEFPLYIFTNEGIWCMQQGEGNVCYARCTLINNTNIDSDTPIITTENNIIYRSGNSLQCLNGSKSSVFLPLTELKQHNFEMSIPSILNNNDVTLTDNSSLTDFLNGDVSMGYRQNHNELIFCNPSYKYCLVMHLPTGHIYRNENSIRRLVQCGNKLLAQSQNNAIYNLNNEINSTSTICLITHPIQLIPDTYTRIKQILLRMSCSYADITIKVLASHEPDGTYGNIYSATYDGVITGHLPIKLFAPAYKHYRVVILGSVSHDFILDCADIAFVPTENNKLR